MCLVLASLWLHVYVPLKLTCQDPDRPYFGFSLWDVINHKSNVLVSRISATMKLSPEHSPVSFTHEDGEGVHCQATNLPTSGSWSCRFQNAEKQRTAVV